MGPGTLLLRRAGPATTVQDLGRPGLGHLAVPPSGAADAVSLTRANALVGNDAAAAGLETTLVGPEVELSVDAVVALTGAECAPRVDGRVAPWDEAFELPAGCRLRVGPLRRGVRAYLAVSGGLDVPAVLGSRSTDVLSGLGPAALRDGDELPLGSCRADAPTGSVPGPTPLADPTPLLLHAGPRRDWLTPAAIASVTTQPWTVRPDSNRVGVRLEGPAMTRTRTEELPSEGLVTGAVQAPPAGGLVIFLSDRPSTGGYPVVGVVAPEDLPRAAQARPGAPLSFRWA
jgi:biotin-dependent carboxylase-like uncharacterized protein